MQNFWKHRNNKQRKHNIAVTNDSIHCEAISVKDLYERIQNVRIDNDQRLRTDNFSRLEK